MHTTFRVSIGGVRAASLELAGKQFDIEDIMLNGMVEVEPVSESASSDAQIKVG